MNNLGDAFEKAGLSLNKNNKNQNEKTYPDNRPNRNQQNMDRQYQGGGPRKQEVEDLGINFENGYDPVAEGKKLVEKMVEKEGNKVSFTTSQLRKIHSYASIVNNRLQMEQSKSMSSSYKISEELQNEIQYIKLKLVYQMGRDKAVKKWFGSEVVDGIKGIGLEHIISDIGDSKEKFDKFYRLLESIIAYKKYLTKE